MPPDVARNAEQDVVFGVPVEEPVAGAGLGERRPERRRKRGEGRHGSLGDGCRPVRVGARSGDQWLSVFGRLRHPCRVLGRRNEFGQCAVDLTAPGHYTRTVPSAPSTVATTVTR